MHLYFEIHASDLDRAKAFYNAVFGWTFSRNESVAIEYYSIDADGSRGGLLKRPGSLPPAESGANAFVCSVEVADFDLVAERIGSAGGGIALPKFPVTGVCWQGYFTDPEGNTFGLFQVDPNAR
ncbi:MAG: VOC family protein [Bacteroidetes bacterium]|nr:VOC family protein [Bacteroidota bacterium]